MNGILVTASRGAIEEALRWGFRGGIVETTVETAFAAGRASRIGEHGRPLPEEKRRVELPDGFVAYVRRDGATLAGRERWRLLSVRRDGERSAA